MIKVIPRGLGGSPVTIYLEYPETKLPAAWDQAVAAGGKVLMPLEKQFWGQVYGMIEDPEGHRWAFGDPNH